MKYRVIGGSRLNSPSLCGKCGRTHVGDSCPGMALTCFHCKEVGHIRRHCPKLPQSVNAVRVDRPRSTVSPERELARLGEEGSTGRVKSWAIRKDSPLSESWLA
ncbi:hypothetical protein Lal_00046755 [Lupinus albus]|nr:hypothetical protein Lal_00046755 [Lupinus albus]